MKKTLALLLVAGSAISLSACGSLPQCNDQLDECTHGGPYTEERTIQTNDRRVASAPVAAPAPAPAPVVAAPAPVAPARAPIAAPTIQHSAPAPVVVHSAPVYDGHIMRSAEPEFRQISK
jgi:hypothetical protein